MSIGLDLSFGFGGSGSGGSVGAGVLQLQNNVPLDTTLRSVTDQANTVSPLQLSTTMVAVVGNASNFLLKNTLSGANGRNWLFETDATHLYLSAYNDAFSSGSIPLYFTRTANNTAITYLGLMDNKANLTSTGFGLGIGATTASARLHVKGDGTNPIAMFEGSGTVGNLVVFGTAATNAFPAIKRNGAAIDFRLADDGGYADLNVKYLSTNVGNGVISFSINGGANGTYFSHAASGVNTFDIGSEISILGSGTGTDAAVVARSGRVLYLGANGVRTLTLNSTKAIFLNSINAANLATTRPATVGEFYQDTAANILANGDKVVGIRQ